jgi:prepilin-type processing-associated H-X9-DG protein
MERTRVSSRRGHAAGDLRGGGLALALVLAVVAARPCTALGQVPAGGPGGGAARGSLARYVPRRPDLHFYLEFEGLDAHQAAWKNSAANKVLTGTKLGALLEDLAGQVIELSQGSAPPEKPIKPAELIGLFKRAARQGFAVGLWGENPEAGGGVIVARGLGGPETIRILEAIAPDPPAAAPMQVGGRTVRSFAPGGWWWIEEGDLVLTKRPELVIPVLDGRVPNVVDHPLRAAVLRKSADFEPIAAGFFDPTGVVHWPPDAVRLGLDGMKRIEFQWGIQDDALLAVVKLVAPQPRRGILTLLDQPTFTARELPPLPAGLNAFAVLSLDPVKVYDLMVELEKQAEPRGGEVVARSEQAIRQQFGFDLRRDVLSQLGPKFAIYSQAPPAAGAAPAAAVMGQVAGLTIAAQARDQALAPNLDNVVESINVFIRMQQAAIRRGRPDPNPAAIAFRKQEAKDPTYVLNLPMGSVPPPLPMLIRPTLKLGKDQLVLGANPAAANRSFGLAAQPPDRLWRPTDAFVPMARRLPRDMVVLAVSDPRDTLPGFIGNLPSLVQQMNMTLLPAVQSAREAARRAQCTNNLKQIGLALNNYESAHGNFPAPAITGKDGRPLLSWRVAILPFLEQGPLYEKFHLDEPWDSPHNKALIPDMPTVFICPSRPTAEPGTTTYRGFTGPGALFESGKQTRLAEITDGTSNTILAVESREAVPWTKPEDLKYDPDAKPSLYGAGSPHPGGFQVLLASGSVLAVGETIDPTAFRALITRNGGEIVTPDTIPGPRRVQAGPPGGGLHVNPDLIPRADELKPLLFPASMAIVSDRDGLRLVSRESFPSISSPAASGVLIALLLPAVQSAREAARRAQCTNNLQQIALAMLNYESANNAFARPAIVGKDGQPLLSWRVAILPYIEQQELYNKFHLDEPWDSPHNKALVNEMPATYLCPSRRNPEPGTTTYRTFVGKGAFFAKDQATAIANITDGTSNTIMVVEASEAVPWTRPDSDLPFDPDARASLYGAGSPHPGGFNATMGDGSVRFIKNSIAVEIFRALITRAGGEVIRGGTF